MKYVIHILDDFLKFSPSIEEGHLIQSAWRSLCETLGWPIAEEKTEGPVQILTFAGIELDTDLMISRLPVEKLRRYSGMIRDIEH